MKIENIYSEIKEIIEKENYIKLPSLLEKLEKTIREESCYKTSNKSRIAGIKRVAFKDNHRPALTGYGILNEYKIVTDSYHLIAIKQEDMPLKLVATPEQLEKNGINLEEYRNKYGINSVLNFSYPDVSYIINFDRSNEIEIDINDIYQCYKLNYKRNDCLYKLGSQNYNIKYLKNLIDVLGKDIKAYETGEYRPLYFENENDEIGLVLPVKTY
ncbi:MAG: hypothetical protein E7174_02250 [Firmicutes bacterium]|nr:hypothetical protein [Bacillota bacterium]